MTVSPTISFWIGVAVTIAIGISGGTVSLTHAVSPEWIPAITAWCNIVAFVGSAVLTALHGISSKAAGPLTK